VSVGDERACLSQECLHALEAMEAEADARQHHRKLVSNALGALSWVSVEFPVLFITETLGSINVFGSKAPPRSQPPRGAHARARVRAEGP
jgi:hypothetical protein